MARKNTFDKKAYEEVEESLGHNTTKDIFSAVDTLVGALEDLMTYSDNPSGTAFVVKGFIMNLYWAKHRIDRLRQQIGEAKLKNDIGAMRSIERQLPYITLNKAIDMYWDTIAKAWDRFLEDNNLSSPDFPLSEEIARDAMNYTAENNAKKVDELAKTCLFSLDNKI